MADDLIWPHLVRPAVPILYLDLNHFIFLARASQSVERAPSGYGELGDALRSAVRSGRVIVPLSAQHVWEMHGIADPRQRRDVATVMEDLSGFQYLLGRVDIGQLEIEAGIRHILGEQTPPVPWPLLRPTIGQALGLVGGVKIVNEAGEDVSESMRAEMGATEFDAFISSARLAFERGLLAGPSDDDAEMLRRDYGYAPEVARASGESRLAFEEDLAGNLAADARWRRGRLRDVVSAREFVHEWIDVLNRLNQQRVEMGQRSLDASDSELLALIAAMPHSQVAISLKTRLHRNPAHGWSTNDIIDIDAMSVAFAYCDAVFTDKAMRHALTSSPELRVLPTALPEGPEDLIAWLKGLEASPLGRDFLIGVSRTRSA
jgi:hypothetical protein